MKIPLRADAVPSSARSMAPLIFSPKVPQSWLVVSWSLVAGAPSRDPRNVVTLPKAPVIQPLSKPKPPQPRMESLAYDTNDLK